MKRCLLALVVCGCAATSNGPAVVIEREITRLPPDLEDCPGVPPAIPAPRQPANLEAIAAWMKLKLPRDEKVEAAAVQCRRTLRALVTLVERDKRLEK